MERQQVHASVVGNNQDMDEEEITIEEEINTDSSNPPEELYNNDVETCYDPEMLQELSGESFNESYEFEGFEEAETHDDPERDLIADRIKAVIKECKVENKQPPSINVEWKKIKIENEKVTNMIEKIKSNNLTDLNYLLKDASVVIVERLEVKQKSEKSSRIKSSEDAWWKRRLGKSIKE